MLTLRPFRDHLKSEMMFTHTKFSWICHIQPFPTVVPATTAACLGFSGLEFSPRWAALKTPAPGLLIFIIHTSCTELLSRMGWDFVTSWKNEILFIYKNGCASVGDIICVSHALAMTLNPKDDVRDHIVSKRESLSLWWGCELRYHKVIITNGFTDGQSVM